ncbi:MAG: acetamidase/formamidase family protein [Candidatus Bathyarchaeota archaeon]|nr:acetamidase/formamidase family protein [Candidatus Bathyarchaeota archaeon]
MIHRYQPTKYYHTYGPNPPALHIKPGDIIITSTVDAGGYDHEGNQITPEMRQSNPDTVYSPSNPLTGPFHVEGAEPGDTLTVEIQRITLTRPTAWSRNASNFGGLTEEAPGRRLLYNDPIPSQRYEWSLDRENNTATTTLPGSKQKNPVIPLHPFIGSIGVAPRYGRVEMSLTPGEYGGNMDFPGVSEGSTLHLPVSWRGALLVFGDVHAAQGDGELCGVALETSAEIQLKLDLIKEQIEWPRVINDDWIMVAGSSRPLMEAYKIAHVEMVKWLTTEYGYDKWDALQLLSQVGRCKIANTVDPNYTVVAKFPRKYLPQ